ncbi:MULTISPECIES: radical SAM protein [Porphyromonas]|uniref:Radical SAM core domain-containing protein n=1 Tax=Porphyromonas crevioricanis TaxID=393921 RepID=A0AB34PIP9_9PORP|nr:MULTISPECIES: radical SAM protein [Porphyromonas]KGN70110.1 hypothetical protein JT26_04235 [Porphyromonas sp. COT-108 OH1349]KGN96822.1 hypothetical protein HQ38_00620 [Porphyromonas crevioricanis]
MYKISLNKHVRVLSSNRTTDRYNLFLDPEKGYWLGVKNEDLSAVMLLLGNPIGVDEFLQIYPSKQSVVRELYYAGLLNINGLPRYQNNTENGCEYMQKEQLIIVVNMTEKCNLACSYCYAHTGSSQNAHFSDEDILSYIDSAYQCFQSTRQLTIVFHGGEPLVIFPRLKSLIGKIRIISNNIRLSVQTNGTLLTSSIADFFKENNVSVGISLDGISPISNNNRPFKSGASSVDAVINGIKNLLLSGNKFGVLSVITPQNIPFIRQTFDFLVDLGVNNFVFNTLLQRDSSLEDCKSVDYESLASAYIDIACRINDLNTTRDCKDFVSERSISTLIKSLLYQEQNICYCTPCGAGNQTIAIDIKGGIYACDCLVGCEEFYLGSIYDKFIPPSPDNHPALSNRTIQMIETCKDCDIHRLCINKCASDSFYRYNDIYHPHSLCRLSKVLIPRLMVLLTENRLNPDLFNIN